MEVPGYPLIPQVRIGYFYGTSTVLRIEDTQRSKTGLLTSGRTSEGGSNRVGIPREHVSMYIEQGITEGAGEGIRERVAFQREKTLTCENAPRGSDTVGFPVLVMSLCF